MKTFLTLFILSLSLIARADKPTTLFGVLDTATIEPVGASYLSLTEFQGGPTRTFLFSFEEDVVDIEKLNGRSAVVHLSGKTTPAPQTGVLHVVARITLFPQLQTITGTLKVNALQGGYQATLTTPKARYAVKLGKKSTAQVEELGLGEHAGVSVTGAVESSTIAAENIE